MNNQLLRTVAAGFLAGIALFIMPFFLVRIVVFFLIIGAIFRLLRFGRRGRFGRRMHPAFTEKFKNMSEEERAAFMQKMGGRCRNFSQKTNTETVQ